MPVKRVIIDANYKATKKALARHSWDPQEITLRHYGYSCSLLLNDYKVTKSQS